METRRITVLSAGLGVPSSSRLLADQLAVAAERQLAAAGYAVTVDVVELRDLAVDIANNFVTGYAAPRLAEVIAGVEASDGIIAVTPVFSASYSGLFKSFIDVLDPKSLEGKAVLLGATGGTDRHQMVLDYAMRPLFSYLRTRVAATAVFAGPQDWGNTDDGGSPLSVRIDRAADEFAGLLKDARPAAEARRRSSPCPSNSSSPESRTGGRNSKPPPPDAEAAPNFSGALLVVPDMKCPVDSVDLIMSERSGVEIDYCPQCRGVWLDRGELDKIIDRAAELMGRRPRPPRCTGRPSRSRAHSAAAVQQPGPAPG